MSKKKKAIRPYVTNLMLFEYGIPVRWIDANKKLVALENKLTGEVERSIMKELGFVETKKAGIFELINALLIVYQFVIHDEYEVD